MNITQRFGKNIRKLRESKGWSQERLAEAANLHRTYISQIECGTRNPTLLIVARIAQALDTQPALLLQEENS